MEDKNGKRTTETAAAPAAGMDALPRDTKGLIALIDEKGGKTLIEVLGEIPDPRRGNAIRHRLDDILAIMVLSTLSGYGHFTEMELFAREREEWLRTFLSLDGGIPSHDTFGTVLAALDPKEIQSKFAEWVCSIREKIEGEVIAIDGKTARGSKDPANGGRPAHIVTAWATLSGLALGEVATDDKSNEITAIPELLDMLDVKGSIVTIDAMGTQRAIAEKIKAKGADYVLAVKGNQPALLEDVSLWFRDFRDGCDSASTSEKSHGRYEKREAWVCHDVSWLQQRGDWEGLSGIGMIRSRRQGVHSEKAETAEGYFIFSKPGMTAGKLMEAKRAHWGIENTLHWALDMDFGEDASRARNGNCAKCMASLRRMALGLVKGETSTKMSMNMKIKKCGLSLDYLLKVIGIKK
jgi:predicted transposase YbfD/YdcC